MASTAQDVGVETDGSSHQLPLVHRGRFRFPPGLRFNLLFYTGRSFFDRRNPILLFEYLTERFGRAAHYRLLWHHIDAQEAGGNEVDGGGA